MSGSAIQSETSSFSPLTISTINYTLAQYIYKMTSLTPFRNFVSCQSHTTGQFSLVSHLGRLSENTIIKFDANWHKNECAERRIGQRCSPIFHDAMVQQNTAGYLDHFSNSTMPPNDRSLDSRAFRDLRGFANDGIGGYLGSLINQRPIFGIYWQTIGGSR